MAENGKTCADATEHINWFQSERGFLLFEPGDRLAPRLSPWTVVGDIVSDIPDILFGTLVGPVNEYRQQTNAAPLRFELDQSVQR